MTVLVLRLALTPATVLLASLVQRRLGHRLGGRVVGLPLTTGPFLLLLLLTEGTAATALAAGGVVAGQLAVVVFCLGYGRLAGVLRRPALTLVAALTLSATSLLIVAAITATWATALVVLAAIAAALLSWAAPAVVVPSATSRWETPVRVVAAGSVVAALTGTVHLLGAQLAGVLSSAPVILSVLAPTTHRSCGPDAAGALLRGTLVSMPGTVVFAVVLAYTVVPLGGAVSYPLAVLGLVLTDKVRGPVGAALRAGTRRLRGAPAAVPAG